MNHWKTLALAGIALPIAFGFTACQTTTVELEQIGRYESGLFAESAAEIVSFDAYSNRVFVINAKASTVDVLGLSDPTAPVLLGSIDAKALGGDANSVDTHHGIVAVAIQGESKQDNGLVAFYNAMDLSLIGQIEVGALPDMVKFSPDGRYVLVANEGEPNDDYSVDPEGSISVINLRRGIENARVRTAGFTDFNDKVDELRAAGVRIYGPNATVAQDLEPEYITISDDGRTAFVTLQENNAVAKVDVRRAKVIDILPLGYKDFSQPENAIDASNKDDGVNIKPWPVLGMYQPDSIDSYTINGDTYFVTANEGDARDYGGYSEEVRVKDLVLDTSVYSDPSLQDSENLGRLKTTTALGDADNDGKVEQIYAYGARSFSIWNASGDLVFDSGNDFETITAERFGDKFNNNNDENDGDSRSDDKGAEPEAIVLGKVLGKTYAFIGLERMGGIMVYDVSVPAETTFVEYITNRNLDVDPGEGVDAGDLAPEGFEFVPAHKSPNGKPLLMVGNEVSGTTTIYQIISKVPAQ